MSEPDSAEAASTPSNGNGAFGQMAQQTYWDQLVLMKVVSCYVRLYRDGQSRWITRIGAFKAVISSSTIGAWAIWKEQALIWGALIAITQVLDALKDFLPQTKYRKVASEFVSSIETMLIDARWEWFSIFSGQRTVDEIMNSWRQLAKQMSEIEAKYFPEGLSFDAKRQALAEQEAEAYFRNMYGVGAPEHGGE